MPFLTAKWRKLAMANYQVDPLLLSKYVPYGTELDFWEGRCYVSLIGFMFVNTQVLGIKIPWHTSFEEVNLRFYVRRYEKGEWRRGVVFIKEFVPRAAITFVANTLYNEHYETSLMKHQWSELNDQREVAYYWKKESQWNHIKLTSALTAEPIPLESFTEFITEHYWGYAKINDYSTNEYEVTHPRWAHYPVSDFAVSVDFGLCYGSDFAMLGDQLPSTVILAEGSAITVGSKRRISS
jgi:uncharacterized protein YqjF (DUF2071 family)